jgi:AraC-like DNA-binding protein
VLGDGGGGRFRSQERHSHDELELHLVVRGRALFVLEDRRLQAAANTLVWIPPRRAHLLLDESPDFRRWLLLVRPRAVRRVLPVEASAGLLGATRTEWLGVLSSESARALDGMYTEVRAQLGSALPLVNAAVAYALARSYVLFQSAAAGPGSSTFHVAVASVLQALRETIPPPSLSELAAHVAMSESHLSKLFSSQVGVSVTEFRNRLRIERFLQLSGDGERRNLMDAALEAGFGSYPQFHRVFRRTMGYPPGQHRRRPV